MVKSVMDAEPTAEQVKEFEAYDTENRLTEEENEREIAAAKGEQTQSEFNPLDGADPRNGRVEDSERDARLRHKDYDLMIDSYIIPLIHRSPEVFTILRDTVNGGEVAYQLARAIQNPQLLEHQSFKGFEAYLKDVAGRRTGRFDTLSVEEFTRALDAYKEHAGDDEDINEFFDK
jgi:hypothetical protein